METSATIGTLAGNALYSYSAHDDGDGRLAESTVKRVSDNATLFDELLSYDPVGNVAGIATTLASGVDHQQFCYDEHNRLTWASATQGATGPCGAIIGANTVPGASYTQSFSYDTLDRLTSGPAGSYSYGDSAHLHGATTVGSGSTAYTARYDAAGDMVCRAPTGSTSCAGGTNTGQQLTWDLEGRLAAWQDAPTSPTTTASYLYDGEGQRVAQRVTASGTTTTTTYVGSLAEYTTTTGGTTSRTDYLYAAGKLVAEAVTSGTPSTTTLTYLVTNAQGTPLEALDGSGAVTASRLYTPYGASRYTSGAFPTSYGYTGQRNDTATELDYYGARYYDPTVGQFTSADTVMAGLSRYGYVGGNPISRTDPSGHMGEKSEKGGGTAVAEGGETTENLQKTVSAGASLFNPGAGSASQIIGLVLVLGAVAIFIKGSFVSSDGSDLIVKSPDGSSATRYSPGDPEYNTWSQAYNDALKDTDVWNARTAPKSGPKPSEPRAPVSEPAGSTPPTPQPGGGSVGAGTPGGGGGGVASPAHPEEDPCACYRTDLSGSKRLDRPPTPQGMSLPEFGKLMQWGRGSEAARAAIGTLSRDILLQRGVTAEMAAAWRDFYINESIRVPGNPSAPGRVDLMQWVCELLR